MKRIALLLVDCFFLLRIPLLVPVWTIAILGWISATPGLVPFWQYGQGPLPSGAAVDFLVALAGFSLVVASIYVVNQIADIDSDRINHKLFLLPHGFVSIPMAWMLAAVCALGGLLVAWNTSPCLLMVSMVSLVLGVLYNLPPARLKDRALAEWSPTVWGTAV